MTQKGLRLNRELDQYEAWINIFKSNTKHDGFEFPEL
jgi:hypothetical protein